MYRAKPTTDLRSTPSRCVILNTRYYAAVTWSRALQRSQSLVSDCRRAASLPSDHRTTITHAVTQAGAPPQGQHLISKRKRVWLRALFGVGLCAALSVPLQIWLYRSALGEGQFDAAVVLGAAVYGSEPSPVFAARLDYALDLLRAKRVRFVVLTGGTHSPATPTEADVGLQYLVDRGANPDSLLLERASRTTLENLCFASAAGRAVGVQSYVIVSDPLHLRRALVYAADSGMRATPGATPYTRYRSFLPWARFLVRESYFYSRRLLFGPSPCPAQPDK